MIAKDRIVDLIAGSFLLTFAGLLAGAFFLTHNRFEDESVLVLGAIMAGWLYIVGIAFSLLFGWRSR